MRCRCLCLNAAETNSWHQKPKFFCLKEDITGTKKKKKNLLKYLHLVKNLGSMNLEVMVNHGVYATSFMGIVILLFVMVKKSRVYNEKGRNKLQLMEAALVMLFVWQNSI